MHSHAGEHGIYREISITEKIPLLFSWRHLANYPVIAVTAINEVAELRGISDQQSEARGRALLAMVIIVAFAFWISALILRVNRNNLELRKSRDEMEDKVLERTADLQTANTALKSEKAHQEELIKKLAEAHNQLLQSEKMASIGQLAAGVAHEINNPIGFVNSNLGTLKRYIEDLLKTLSAYEENEGELTAKTREELKTLKQQIDIVYLRGDVGNLLSESMEGMQRVKRIVQDLKDFSHVDEAKMQSANLEQGLDSTLNVVWNELKYKAEVVKEYGSIPEIECIPSQLNQVFMNLLTNAVQAIEGHGKITIRTGQDGDNVWVEVEDTGKGIKPEHLDRIFEPFFTTKPVGSGTGLGLSLSYGIVQKHGGKILVKSEVGKGSVFRVELPQHGITAQSSITPTKDGK
jgi:signal transduction histidine kinase